MNRQAVNKSVSNDASNDSSLTNQLKRKRSVQKDSCVSPIAAASAFAQDFSAIPVKLNSVPVSVQPKLKIGDANDKYEQEADSVANQVMRMPDPNTNSFDNISNVGNSLQRKHHSSEQDKLVQRKSSQSNNLEISPSLRSQISSLSGGGRAISASERGFFEPRFKSDFSNVRVHDNSESNNMAQAINARAFTFGNNVVFGSGEYSPNTESGKRLFAHELTHVLQQNSEQSSDSTTIQNEANHKIQRDLLDDVLGAEGAQFVSDLGSTVTEAPSHFGEILGEVVDSILEHWIAFSATLLLIIAIEGVIVALAGVPEPTTATKWAALILQALMLLIIGAIAAVELGQVVTHTHRWLTATWEARGDPEKITEASKYFCRMLLHMVLLILALIGVRARAPAVRGAARALRPVQRMPVPPTPNGMSLAEFGRVMLWGNRDAAARARMGTLTRTELVEAGVTRTMAEQWRDFYINEVLRVPTNPSARGRSELMQRAVELLD